MLDHSMGDTVWVYPSAEWACTQLRGGGGKRWPSADVRLAEEGGQPGAGIAGFLDTDSEASEVDVRMEPVASIGDGADMASDWDSSHSRLTFAEALHANGASIVGSYANHMAVQLRLAPDAERLMHAWCGVVPGGQWVQDHGCGQAWGDAAHCWGCALYLFDPGVEWRICNCFAPFCLTCATTPCFRCGHCLPEARSFPQAVSDLEPSGNEEMETLLSTLGGNEYVHQHVWLTPDEAWERRERMIEDARVQNRVSRAQAQRSRSERVRQGRCPRRRPKERDAVFITSNVTHASSLRNELEYGTALRNATYITVQELRLDAEAIDIASRWADKAGWSLVAGSAYKKTDGLGGGTGILGADRLGVRPAPGGNGSVPGRLTIGIADFNGDIAIGSAYGVSGGSLADQMPLWRGMALVLRTLGLPFVIGGDWQCPPAALEMSGLPELLGAKICAPDCATNTTSGRTIDYFWCQGVCWTVAGPFGQSTVRG